MKFEMYWKVFENVYHYSIKYLCCKMIIRFWLPKTKKTIRKNVFSKSHLRRLNKKDWVQENVLVGFVFALQNCMKSLGL